MTDVSLFIGRFQPFHKGHLFVLQKSTTELIYIGIGSSQYHHTLENPFTFDERKQMIQLALSQDFDNKFDIYAVPDIHDPPNWVVHVQKLLPPFSTVLTNNEWTADLFKEKGYTIKKPGLYNRHQCMGKEIRLRMIKKEPWQHLVPDTVAKYLEEINAEKRMQMLTSGKE